MFKLKQNTINDIADKLDISATELKSKSATELDKVIESKLNKKLKPSHNIGGLIGRGSIFMNYKNGLITRKWIDNLNTNFLERFLNIFKLS